MRWIYCESLDQSAEHVLGRHKKKAFGSIGEVLELARRLLDTAFHDRAVPLP
jgi:hypothetical protein